VPDAGRVVTGSAGGLRLDAPGPGTRPFSNKAKQALFSMLESERDDVWADPMLDLFAGSGAAGIEALSRGVPRAVLVERDPRAVAVIRRNLERTHLADGADVIRADVVAWLVGVAPQRPFGVVILDPPYAQAADLQASLERLGEADGAWLVLGALVAVKHFWKDAPVEWIGRLHRIRERRFGETALSVYRRQPELAAGDR
jgi:16S rRNA (guanine966-N2)-methyltransferase